MGAAGAFAYATIDDAVRTHHIQTSGNAYYEGETIAVSGNGTLYVGDMALEVRFRSAKVSGLVTNLASEDGEPWSYNLIDVHSIILPTADLSKTASWSASGSGYVVDQPRPGSRGQQPGPASFSGDLLGTGEDAGSQAAGVWTFGKASDEAKSRHISGGFGAVRTESVIGPDLPGTGEGTDTEAVSIAGTDTERKADLDGILVDVGTPDAEMRLLGASLGDGMLTIHGQLRDSSSAHIIGDSDEPELQTFEISLATLFDKAGTKAWYNSDTQVNMAREEIEDLRDRLEGFSRIDEDSFIRVEKDKIWTAIIDVLSGRIFDSSGVKRTAEDSEGRFVMEATDAVGYKIYATGQGGPDLDTGFADLEIDSTTRAVGPPSGTDAANTWMVVEAPAGDDDLPGTTRLMTTAETPVEYVIYGKDKMLLTGDHYDEYLAARAAAVVAETDPDEVEIDAGGRTILAQGVKLVNKLKNGDIGALALGSEAYPTRGGKYDDAEALSAIDDVLQALASEDALEDGLASGGALENLNGSEKATGDPEDAGDDAVVAVGDIWGRKEARVQVRLGSTNYTRFGVWRKETNKAANLGYTKLADAADENSGDGPGAFAYSSLPATEYQSAADSTYPGGGSATYTGETVALQGTTHYTGLISVTASWEASWTGLDTTGAPTDAADDVTDYMLGTVTAVISGLETDDGDPLQRYMTSATQTGDNPDTDAMESTSNEYVTTTAMDIREIIFTGVNITTPNDEDDNTLGFRSDFMGTDAGDPRARITTMIGSDPSTLVGGGVDQTGTDATMESAMLVGTFVGQDVDGPLGVIGRWKLMDPDGVMSELESVERTFPDDGSATQVNTNEVTVTDGDLMKIGDGTTLYGAFGAEVEP
jgi:hypothetical protein